MQAHAVGIRKTIATRLPGIPYERIARSILGPSYELSLVICGDRLAKRMNREYRNKTYKPNVLSFPLSKTDGEIFLNIRCAEREAKKYNIPLRERLAVLFIHGCYHLKGLDHGTRMETLEKKTLAAFRLG